MKANKPILYFLICAACFTVGSFGERFTRRIFSTYNDVIVEEEIVADESENSDALFEETLPSETYESDSLVTKNSDAQNTSENSRLININEADAEELTALYGIGEKLSERIVEYREKNGQFEVIEDIMKVSGIGSKKIENIKDSISVN